MRRAVVVCGNSRYNDRRNRRDDQQPQAPPASRPKRRSRLAFRADVEELDIVRRIVRHEPIIGRAADYEETSSRMGQITMYARTVAAAHRI
jgi:hypothetical protein